MTVKMNLFCGGKFWKATFVCRMLPQGLLFLKNRHFWKFETCPFWKKCVFPHIWSFSDWRRRRRRPKNSPHLVRPLDHHVQGANIPFGNPSLRSNGTYLFRGAIMSKWRIPERDIWFLCVMVQGSCQIGRVLGTPSPPPPSPGSSGWHSGQETIFGVFKLDFDTYESSRDLDTGVLHRIPSRIDLA